MKTAEDSVKNYETLKPTVKFIQTVKGRKCLSCGSTEIALFRLLTKVEYGEPSQKAMCWSCGGEETARFCPECEGVDIAYDEHHAELYCEGCGLVLGCSPPLNCNYKKIIPDWFILIKRVNF